MMAYSPIMPVQSLHNSQQLNVHINNHQAHYISRQRFSAELSKCLFDFVIQLLPTPEELAVKEDVRKLLERLIRTIEPNSRLLSFGSTANGFSLRNSDMDLCCLIDSGERLSATDLVTMLGDLLNRETKFHVKPLPHARIPIVKLSLDPSPGLPLGIACDIGFENRLALENTRLLMCYAMIDPTRVRTMVLFLKVWSKRRKINSPYKGTLSSYGYVLLVIYFLVHVKNPPVLPNLQMLPPLRPISEEDTHLNGHNIWFFDDIELLSTRWHSENTESIAELLTDFFRYFSKEFLYNTGVASIREGLLTKESKGWQNDLSSAGYNDSRERNRFCIEDPFEVDFNVSRCVTRDGLYTIRGEFMRAGRILAGRPERALLALSQLCEERGDDLVTAPNHKLAPIPPQTPYNIGSRDRMTTRSGIKPDSLSPPTQFYEPGPQVPASSSSALTDIGSGVAATQEPPEHMAPKRSKWTSPPPPEATSSEFNMFQSSLDIGLEIATGSTNARERERTRGRGRTSDDDTSYRSESSNSERSFEINADEQPDAVESDDVSSVRSFTEGAETRRSSWLKSPPHETNFEHVAAPSTEPPPLRLMTHNPTDALPQAGPMFRGRSARTYQQTQYQRQGQFENAVAGSSRDVNGMSRAEYNRRSWSGPPRSWNLNVPYWTLGDPSANLASLANLGQRPNRASRVAAEEKDANVYYQTTAGVGVFEPNLRSAQFPIPFADGTSRHQDSLLQAQLLAATIDADKRIYQSESSSSPKSTSPSASEGRLADISGRSLSLGPPPEDSPGTPTPYSQPPSSQNAQLMNISLASNIIYSPSHDTISSGYDTPTPETAHADSSQAARLNLYHHIQQRHLQRSSPIDLSQEKTASLPASDFPTKTVSHGSTANGATPPSSSTPTASSERPKFTHFLVPDETASFPSSTATTPTPVEMASRVLVNGNSKRTRNFIVAPTEKYAGSPPSASVSTTGSESPTPSLSSYTTAMDDMSRSPSPVDQHDDRLEYGRERGDQCRSPSIGPLVFGTVGVKLENESGHGLSVGRRKTRSKESMRGALKIMGLKSAGSRSRSSRSPGPVVSVVKAQSKSPATIALPMSPVSPASPSPMSARSTSSLKGSRIPEAAIPELTAAKMGGDHGAVNVEEL
ncbi:hypothetical protein BDV98DRAFT_338843 [Pterulicium gracile]|uniref:polynucleotide adenylyltransferase n=1 Tax=Pterulicium gracile TaxID=1884261 RepID=A0A5C3Q4K2_9AGAR|nr:hypothetical protein BDV98DRAFT_338843 [Pterula gracilis]